MTTPTRLTFTIYHAMAFAGLAAFAPLSIWSQEKPMTPAEKKETAVVLDPFTIVTERDTGFVASSSLAGGRLATDLKDTPV
ncbi:MAG TPA: hypothetical protein VKC60_02500, partial [Opitutaceae bacterium]|nr:hypothetical protein [Opitutaceae bacterium]